MTTTVATAATTMTTTTTTTLTTVPLSTVDVPSYPRLSAPLCRHMYVCVCVYVMAVAPGYDDNFVGDEEDQKMLAGLDEIARDEILTQRREKRLQQKEVMEVSVHVLLSLPWFVLAMAVVMAAHRGTKSPDVTPFPFQLV